MTEVYLVENREGIVQPRAHARMILSKEKTHLVLGELFEKMIDRPLYLIQDGFAVGVIKLGTPKFLEMDRFMLEQQKHRMTEAEGTHYFRNKQMLFMYDITIVESFDPPLELKSQPTEGIYYMKDFEFQETSTVSPGVSGIQGQTFPRKKKRAFEYSYEPFLVPRNHIFKSIDQACKKLFGD